MNWSKLKATVLAYVLNREPLPKDPKEADTQGKQHTALKADKSYPHIGATYTDTRGNLVDVVDVRQGVVYYTPMNAFHHGDMDALSCVLFNSLYKRRVRDLRPSSLAKVAQ